MRRLLSRLALTCALLLVTPAVAQAAVPATMTAPAVSGTPQVGQTLTTTTGAWTNSPTSFTISWRRCAANVCAAASAASATTYAVQSADVGSTLNTSVKACNASGCSGWVLSNKTAVVTSAPSSSYTVPPCDYTAVPGTSLNGYATNLTYQNKVVCLPDGNYTLNGGDRTPGVQFWSQHQYQAKVWGWLEVLGAGEQFHGVYLNNCSGPGTTPGACANPGAGGGSAQSNQVFANDFQFVDSELTNNNTITGFFLGQPAGQGWGGTNGAITGTQIVRDKMWNIGGCGGTGCHHVIYADNASGQITDNWIWHSLGFGVTMYPYSAGLHVDYNVIDQQQEACADFASSGGGNTVEHNICANVTTMQYGVGTCCSNNGSGDYAGYNWFFNVPNMYEPTNITLLGHDGSGSPGFVDATNHNYNLVSGAPATGYGPRTALP